MWALLIGTAIWCAGLALWHAFGSCAAAGGRAGSRQQLPSPLALIKFQALHAQGARRHSAQLFRRCHVSWPRQQDPRWLCDAGGAAPRLLT